MSYQPRTLSATDVVELAQQVQDELYRIAETVNLLAAGRIEITYVAPDKPRVGDIRYADGTNWNPGSGAGLYQYRGSSWVFFG